MFLAHEIQQNYSRNHAPQSNISERGFRHRYQVLHNTFKCGRAEKWGEPFQNQIQGKRSQQVFPVQSPALNFKCKLFKQTLESNGE